MFITIDPNSVIKQVNNFWNHIHFHPTDAIEDRWGQNILGKVSEDKVAGTVRMHTMFVWCSVILTKAESSPFFSVYAATKAALKIFIESVNVELLKAGCTNQILNVSPGSLKGTSFSNAKTDLSVIASMAQTIIVEMEKKNDLYIPQYEEVFRNVLQRYQEDFRKEGAHSYDYKLQRLTEK